MLVPEGDAAADLLVEDEPPCTFRGVLRVLPVLPEDIEDARLAELIAGKPLLEPESVLILSLLP